MKKDELQKYVKSKVPTKPGTSLPWKNRSQDETKQGGTSKSGENLRVVSFIHQENDEKRGRYEEFESRRLERGLRTIALKGYVNTISRGQFHHEKVPIIFSDQDLERVNLLHTYPLVIKLRIGDTMVSRVLVDGASSSDILLWDAFWGMGIEKEDI